MERLRVAAVNMNPALGEVERNLDAIASWTVEAREGGAELILFPELAVNGHCDPEAWYHAEAVPAGAATQRICDLAQQHGAYLCAGLSEKEGDLVYNTQVLAGPDGFIGAQRKVHLSRDEVIHYNVGSAIEVFDIGKCRVGIAICYDSWFPEVPRILAVKGAEVLLMPHASRWKMWSDDPASERAAAEFILNLFHRTHGIRAMENACFAVVCNQAGRSGYVKDYPADSPNQPHHAGGALVFDPLGELIATTQPTAVREEILYADLLPERLWQARSDPNYQLRRRRPEMFGALVAKSAGS